jgi:ABC-2 type transport system ATP-binding protein
MRRKAYLAAALASHADIILIDEAFDGLDPYSRNEFKKDIIDLIDKNPKTTVIIASHSLRELDDICDSYSLVDNGQISDEFLAAKEMHKVRLAFTDEATVDVDSLNPLMVKRDGHFLTIVVEASEADIRSFFEPYKPLMMDILPLTVEEAFIYNKEREML